MDPPRARGLRCRRAGQTYSWLRPAPDPGAARAQGWDYRPVLLERAAARLEALYQAAARNTPDDPAAVDELRRLLAADLNVPAALDLAAEAGGAAARTLASVLGLT